MTMFLRRSAFSLAASAVLIGSITAGAQTFRGTLTGTVTDPTGAAIPNATVELANPATNITYNSKATAEGNFSFPELPVGIYRLTATSPGFVVQKVDKINIEVSKITNLKVQLTVGSESTVVDVTASGVQLDTTTSSLVAVVDSKSVQAIPLNGRNFTQMVTLAAGVNFSKSVNGSRTNGINYQLDGADNNDPWSNAVASNQGGVAGIAGGLIPIEAIDQFSMQTAGESDQGRNGGGNSNMVLRSGTNNLHGDVFYFDRNEYFAWLSAVQAPHTRVPEIRNHQGGFTLGGPIWKDHTFLFLAGEIQIANANSAIADTVLSDSWINQAKALIAQYPTASVNPVSTNLYTLLFPAVSRTGPASSGNYLANGRNTYNSYNGIIKLDHKFSDREQFSVHYLGTTGTQSADVGSHYADYFQTAPMHIHNFSAILNSTFSPTLVNQVTFAGSSFLQTFNDRNQNFNTQGTGLNLGLTGTLAQGATNISVSGFDYTGATPPLGRQDVTGHVDDTLHWTIGKHSLKFGGEYRHANLNVAYYTNGRGLFKFDGTRGPWASSSASSALKSVADFVAGMPTNASGATILRNNPQRVYLVNTVDAWVSDTWQITPKLSANYGIRYSYPGVVKDDRNSLYNFDPTVAGGFSPIPLYNINATNFAPRVGLSYSLNDKMVFRAGYGIFFDQPTVGQFVYNSIGNGGATGIYSNPAGPSPVFAPVVSNVTFQSGAQIFPATLANVANNSIGAFSIDKNYKEAYLQQYHLDIEDQLAKNTLITISYAGSQGRRLALVRDINQIPAGSSTRPYAAIFPTLNAINQVQSKGMSNYNAYLFSLRQQVWHGLSATGYYTFGKSLDNVSSVTTPMNSYNLSADYGPSTFDNRHTFTGFLSYDVPQLWHGHERLTKGYSVKALYLYSSGTPINILVGTNVSGTGENKDRPNVVAGATRYSARTVIPATSTTTVKYAYLSSATNNGVTAFTTPAAGTYGNLSRDAVYGPGFGDTDLSFFKITKISEKISTELRAEIFNITNHANFANPSGTLNSSSYGQLTATRNASSAPGLGQGEPRNMQFAFKVAF